MSTSLPRRFCGRPETPPSVSPVASRAVRVRSGALWLAQVIAGALLLGFLGVHIAAQHFLAPGGLRDFSAVVAYLRQPVALVGELGLLAAVLVHAVLGVRSALVDILPTARMLWIATWILVGLAGLGLGYAVWLTFRIVSST